MKYYTSQPYEIHLYNQDTSIDTSPESCTLLYVIAGTLTLSGPTISRKVCSTGGIYMFEQDTTQTCKININVSTWYAVIVIDANYIDVFNQNEHVRFLVDTGASSFQDYLRLNQAIQKTLEEYFHPETATQTKIGNNMERCVNILIQNHIHPDCQNTTFSTPESRRLCQLKCFIHTHAHKNISLDTLSEKLNMTPQYVSLYVKKNFGTTFIKYVTAIRLDIVRKYLIYSNESITHIVPCSGFPNAISLNTAFKKHFGMTPMEYRKKYQKDVHSYSMLYCDNDRYEQDLEIFNDIPGHVLMTYSQKLNTSIDITMDALPEKETASLIQADILCLHDCRELSGPSMNALLDDACKNLPLKYVRVIGLHAPQKYVAPETDPFFAYRLSIQIIEIILNHGLYPVILCPVDAHDGNTEKFPAFLDYCIDHFGPRCVGQWMFEFCLSIHIKTRYQKSPDAFWDTLQDMIRLINDVREKSPQSKIGGFNIQSLHGTEYPEKFLEAIKNAGIIPDFLTYHLTSTYHSADSDEAIPEAYKLSINSDLLVQRLTQYRRIQKRIFGDAPIETIAELTFNTHADSLLNDSLFNATYLLMNCMKLRPLVSHLILPTLSDITYFAKPTRPTLFYGSNTLYTHFGIPKPALFAMKFWGLLKGKILSAGSYHLVTLDNHECIRILLCNHKFPDALYCSNPESSITPEQFYSLFPDLQPEKYAITVTGTLKKQYMIETHTLNKDHGSVLDCWLAADCPRHYSKSLIEQQKQVIHPDFKFVCVKSNGRLQLEESLKSLEIKFIKIYPALEEARLPF